MNEYLVTFKNEAIGRQVKAEMDHFDRDYAHIKQHPNSNCNPDLIDSLVTGIHRLFETGFKHYLMIALESNNMYANRVILDKLMRQPMYSSKQQVNDILKRCGFSPVQYACSQEFMRGAQIDDMLATLKNERRQIGHVQSSVITVEQLYLCLIGVIVILASIEESTAYHKRAKENQMSFLLYNDCQRYETCKNKREEIEGCYS